MAGGWGRLWRGLVLVLAMAAPAGAETRLSIPEARQFAIQLVQSGQPQAARAAALALLQHDPGDVIALIVLSRAARDLGEYRQAEAAARRAFQLADTDKNRFAAALAMAQALSSDGRRTAAQFWLRRAAEAAPDDRHRMVAVRDFAYVRAKNPVKARLRFGAFPSSNINDGPVTNTIVIGGLEFINPDAVPLSGFGFSGGFDLSRAWDIGPKQTIALGLTGDATTYVLSQAAKTAVPDADAADFGTASLGATLGWTRQEEGQALSAALSVGRDWQGGAVLSDWTQVRLGYGLDFADNQRLSLGLTLTDTARHDAAIRSSLLTEAELGWAWGAAGKDRFDIALTLGKLDSDAASVARSQADVQLRWQRAKPLLGVGVSAFASLGLRAYDDPLYIAEARQDVTARLGLTAVLTEVDYLGFAPEVGVTFSRTNSNISAMTTQKAELRLGIRSTF